MPLTTLFQKDIVKIFDGLVQSPITLRRKYTYYEKAASVSSFFIVLHK